MGFMSGLAGGLAQGLNQADQVRANAADQQYKQQKLAIDQGRLDVAQQQAASTINLNNAKLTGEQIANEKAMQDQQFNNGVIKAAATGGFSAALDYAQHTGHYEWAAARQKEQIDLNNSIAQGMKLKADASSSEITAYNSRIKALGALGGQFFQDPTYQQDPAATYQKYLPTIKQIWPDAPKEYNDSVENNLKIAVGQGIQQNTNYTRMSTVGKLLSERKGALAAGDQEAVRVYDAQLQKQSMLLSPQTGDYINLLGNAPDEHQGSVDTKMAAVGLSAASQIPPIPGAHVVQQPLNNHMDSTYKAYDDANGITEKDRTIRNLKATQGYNMVIHPDGTQSMQPIAGGPADKPKVTASESVRIASLQVGQKAFNQYSDLLIDPATGKVKPGISTIITGTLAQAKRVGSFSNDIVNQINNQFFTTPQARQVKTIQDNIIEGILRGQSGATINITERPRFEQELLPQPGDDDATIHMKLKLTHEMLNGSLDILKKGLNGSIEKDKDGNGIVDWEKINKLKDYELHGGDVLDHTRGNGIDPEKARKNELVKLSVSPQEVEYYKDPAHNGQGKVLSEDDARALAIQYRQAQQQKQGVQ